MRVSVLTGRKYATKTIGVQSRNLWTTRISWNEQKAPIESQEVKRNPHKEFYQNLFGPFIKVTAITYATFYGMKYLWDYLDTEEVEK